MQPEFAHEIFSLCKKAGINTCLDTSGSILNDSVKNLLSHTDRVLLDIKYTNEEDYKQYVGCEFKRVLEFLEYLNNKNIPVTLRQVIIPTLNDNTENILKLNDIIKKYNTIDKTELLPFKKLSQFFIELNIFSASGHLITSKRFFVTSPVVVKPIQI